MILFEDKRIHGATSITLLIGLVIMSIFFMSLYVSDIVEKNSEIYERKQRIAALEERYLSILWNKSIFSFYRLNRLR